jgi:DNA invertase Pin-like site-specific DNA recombinase
VCVALQVDASTPNGHFFITVLCAFNELERKNAALKISTNMKVLSKEGKLRNKAPFGYKFVGKDKDFEPVPEQQQVIKMIVNLYNTGTNANRIASILNTGEYGTTLNINKKKASLNPQFYHKTVQRILADQGIIELQDRKPVEQRIKTYHKDEKVSVVI